MLNQFFVKVVGYNERRKISINVFLLKYSVSFWNAFLDRFSSTNYSLQWLEFHTLLATINMKFARGYRKNKSNVRKLITLKPQIRKREHLKNENRYKQLDPTYWWNFILVIDTL